MQERPFDKVGVLLGGPSSEREVSLRSGKAVANGLRQAGYDVTDVDITARRLDLPAGLEAAFVALHGEFGEDGQIQALLRDAGMPYTGSSPESSLASFDKRISKDRFAGAGIPTPAFEYLKPGDRRTLPLPVVVKPVLQGSSIGVHIVTEEGAWPAALEDALSYDGVALVEEFIAGSELTVGIVGRQVLPVIEIRAQQGFYDFNAKYRSGKTEYLVPAPIPADRAAECGRLALETFDALGCRDLGRVDFRMDAAGRLFVLELNNIPGFTETSLLPKAGRAAGIEFFALCDRIMRMASVH